MAVVEPLREPLRFALDRSRALPPFDFASAKAAVALSPALSAYYAARWVTCMVP